MKTMKFQPSFDSLRAYECPSWFKGPENGCSVLRSYKAEEKIMSVRLLGLGSVPFNWNYGVLAVKLPEQLPTPYINCLAIELSENQVGKTP